MVKTVGYTSRKCTKASEKYNSCMEKNLAHMLALAVELLRLPKESLPQGRGQTPREPIPICQTKGFNHALRWILIFISFMFFTYTVHHEIHPREITAPVDGDQYSRHGRDFKEIRAGRPLMYWVSPQDSSCAVVYAALVVGSGWSAARGTGSYEFRHCCIQVSTIRTRSRFIIISNHLK